MTYFIWFLCGFIPAMLLSYRFGSKRHDIIFACLAGVFGPIFLAIVALAWVGTCVYEKVRK